MTLDCKCVSRTISVYVVAHIRQRNTECGFLCCKSKVLGEAVNKRFSVSAKWEVPLLIRRARGLRERERESIELGPLWVSTKVTVE